jgi:hypothetical protein
MKSHFVQYIQRITAASQATSRSLSFIVILLLVQVLLPPTALPGPGAIPRLESHHRWITGSTKGSQWSIAYRIQNIRMFGDIDNNDSLGS